MMICQILVSYDTYTSHELTSSFYPRGISLYFIGKILSEIIKLRINFIFDWAVWVILNIIFIYSASVVWIGKANRNERVWAYVRRGCCLFAAKNKCPPCWWALLYSYKIIKKMIYFTTLCADSRYYMRLWFIWAEQESGAKWNYQLFRHSRLFQGHSSRSYSIIIIIFLLRNQLII